jgi:hypothetical protein
LTIDKGLAGEREALETRGETFTFLDQSLDGFDRGVGIDVQGEGVTLKRVYKNLHVGL